MSDERLLLSSDKSGIFFENESISPWWRKIAIAVGLFVLGVGLFDVLGRIETRYLTAGMPTQTVRSAFAPIGTLDLSADLSSVSLPKILNTFFGTETDQNLVASTTKLSVPPVATTTPLIPARIEIPSIGVDARVEQVGLKSDNKTMAAPSTFTEVAWYKLGSKPGEEGNAVFAGHLNSPILLKVGVFEKLSKTRIGDVVIVSNADGRSLTYEIEKIDQYLTNVAPTEEIFSSVGLSKIILVTCEGEWNERLRTFDKRLVVTARLVR